MESIFSLRDLCITEIVLACYMNKAYHGTPIHKDRPSHGIAFLADGKNRYTFSDGTVFDLQKGQGIYLPKGSSYVVQTLEPCECYAINFQLLSELTFPAQVLEFPDSSHLLTRFSQAAAVWTEQSDGDLLQVRATLYEILHTCHQVYTAANAERKIPYAIRQGVVYLNQHYTDSDLTIPLLAQQCNISDTHFRALFRQGFGVPPIRYLNRRRMELAKQLLLAKEHTVTEIQQLCGFRDACRFSREFKKYYGCAPSVYLHATALTDKEDVT